MHIYVVQLIIGHGEGSKIKVHRALLLRRTCRFFPSSGRVLIASAHRGLILKSSQSRLGQIRIGLVGLVQLGLGIWLGLVPTCN